MSPYTCKRCVRSVQACEKVSDSAHQLLISVKVDPADPSMLASFLFCERTLRGCQAAIRLCEFGLIQEAQVLLRTAFETSFHAQALIVKPEIFKLLDAHEGTEGAKQAAEMLKDIPPDQLTGDDREALGAIINRGQGKKFSAHDSARIAGMLKHYSVEYRGLSALAGHATFRSLDHSLVEDGDGIELRIGPSENQLVFTLSLAAQCMGFAVGSLKHILGLPPISLNSQTPG